MWTFSTCSGSATAWTCWRTIRKRSSRRYAKDWRTRESPLDEMRVDEPTLENVFVAKLRGLGQGDARRADSPRSTTTPACAAKSRSAPPTLPSNSAISPRSTTSASRFATAKSTACSEPTAPARPPPSRCSAGCSIRPAARWSWRASAATCGRRRCASASATCRRSSRSTTT